MSLRLEMLQVARLASRTLGDSAALVRAFLRRQQNADGSFPDRAGQSDLYYTVFGLDSLIALDAELPQQDRLGEFLRGFGTGEGLDFVHLCCLARCWAAMANLKPPAGAVGSAGPADADTAFKASLLARLERHRTADGGYNALPNQATGTAYGCFLALGAYQDLRGEMPAPTGLKQCLAGLETADGVWTNERPPDAKASLQTGSTNATAAAVSILRHLDAPLPLRAGDWLLARAHPQGGFLAMPQAPMPDLLSTATALHALAGLQAPFEPVKDACLDFIDSLWTNEGAFHGHWADDHLDCEYTFYGLLALGHLSL